MDVDTGADDAMAIALASSLPTVCVEAVTVAAGNTNMSTAYDNTLKVLSTLNRTNVSYCSNLLHFDVVGYTGSEETEKNTSAGLVRWSTGSSLWLMSVRDSSSIFLCVLHIGMEVLHS